MKYCTKCGRELTDDVKFCPHCGNPIPDDQNVAYVSSNPTSSTSYSVATSKRNSLALAGFICSLASFVFGGIVVAIVGLVLCCISRKRRDECQEWNAFIKPGIVVGIISIIVYVIALIVAISLVVALV